MAIQDLVGQKIVRIEKNDDNDRLLFYCENGRVYLMYHAQDCCESVSIDDINGELKDLIGWPVLSAEETSNSQEADGGRETWTFYHIRNFLTTVTIKWYGSSNGYYSEDVSFVELEKKGIDNIQDTQFEIV